jgi:hypothetical protein
MSHVVLDSSEESSELGLGSYLGLKETIASHLDRDDLTAHISQFIRLAESRFRRDIRIREMLTREPIIIYSNVVELPDGILETLSLRLMTRPIKMLSEVSFYDMERYRRYEKGLPRFFSLRGHEIEFDVEPVEAIEAEILYYKELDHLSEDVDTNALLRSAPDVYLYGSLAASAPFLMNDERIPVWETLYAQGAEGLKRLNSASRRVGPLVSRVAGATP